MKFRDLAIIGGIATAALSAPAHAVVFDFEDQALTAFTSLTQTIGSDSLTVTRMGGTNFDIRNVSSGGPSVFGSRTLSPFTNTALDPFVFDFSSGFNSFSVDMGDYVPSDTDTLTIEIFTGAGGTGTSLGFATRICCDVSGNGFPGFETLQLYSATPFLSAVVNGGSTSFPTSIFIDNVNVSVGGAVPEPATWAMLILGFGAIGGAMRRQKVRTSVSYA